MRNGVAAATRAALGGMLAWALVGLAAPAAATADPAACKIGQLLELKVTMENMHPMVAATINGHEERFIADSGAFYSNITPGTAAELGLHLAMMPPNFHLRGIGGETTAWLTTVKSVGLAGVPLSNIQFLVGGSEVGHGAGLLGQNVLGIGDVEYDLENGAIRLMRSHGCKGVIPAYWSAGKPVSMVTIEPRDAQHPHTIGTVTVNGVKLRAIFDTGAAESVMSLAAAARIGIRPDSPGVRAAGQASGIGRHTVANYVIPIDSIQLGDGEEIKRTHIRAAAMELGDGDLLIGADFFLSHRVYVANGMHRLFFTYDGGPVFNVTPGRVVATDGTAASVPTDVNAVPTDAAGFSRRGAAYLARREYAKALADLDKAVALAPTESRYLYQRAQAHAVNREPLLAMDDLDKTLTLSPDDADARLARASIRLGRHDRAAAAEDVAAVDARAAPAADARLQLAEMDEAIDEPAKAVGQYDLWLRYHGEDSRRPIALGGRCRARATLGVDLGKALSDCDGALKARPDAIAWLDARALVRLRQGDNERAVGDFDAALALRPKMAWPLYARGLAKQRLGRKAEGQQDIDAATALDSGVGARAKRLGLAA